MGNHRTVQIDLSEYNELKRDRAELLELKKKKSQKKMKTSYKNKMIKDYDNKEMADDAESE